MNEQIIDVSDVRLRACELPELPACAAMRHIALGVIFAGKRHAECIASANSLGLGSKDCIQGFMTTKGRFVNRQEAFRLMQNEGIESASPDGYRGFDLYSEDLY